MSSASLVGESPAPFISIVIPSHNRPDTLAEALASVRAQTFTDYEIIVVSNGESDGMRQQTRAVANAHRAQYFVLDEGSVSIARNFGLAKARGEWIAFLDDDDIWLPEKLARQLAAARQTGADLIACDCVRFFPDGTETLNPARLIDGWSYTKAINHHYWWTIPSAVLVRASVVHKTGGYDESLAYIEDMDLWRRISWCYTIHQMDEVLCRWRSGHLNTMHPQNARKRARWELCHYRKMQQDTPPELRAALPPWSIFAVPRIITAYAPGWFVNVCRVTRPRTRWVQFMRWLRPHGRLHQLRYRLRPRT
jgi:glycosyltransferase involved in cell wall biosynthesis